MLTAGIVVTASVVVERSGPLIGALVVTLPVTVWPAYLFLSLDHDAEFLAASAGSGLAVNAVSGVFMLVYVILARRRGLLLSLGAALACWIALAAAVRSASWTPTEAGLLNLIGFPACIWLSRKFRDVEIPRALRQWYELPLRTLLVCVLMGAVLLLGSWAGPIATGMIAVYPISTTSTMLIVHSRIGGRASAAVVANGLWGMLGIAGGLYALATTVVPYGKAIALALALAIPVAWNLSVWRVRRERRRAAKPRGGPGSA